MTVMFAPMEGITLSAFRKVHTALFPGTDAWMAPFIAPDGKGGFREKNLRELLPDNNTGIRLIPQLLVNRAEPFLITAARLREIGYDHVNLNTGCPSATVFSKHKGAGMLADPPALDRFLEEVFSGTDMKISIKTRMGVNSTREFPALMEVFRKYPLRMLIVHARHREGFYASPPDREGFLAGMENAPFPVCYNGNIFSPADLEELRQLAPALEQVMVGRGAVADPSLIRQLKGGERLRPEELLRFHDLLLETLLENGLSPDHALSHMKELWYYMIHMFSRSMKLYKQLNKTRRLPEYRDAVKALFESGYFDGNRGFSGGPYSE